jgi:hypothetical protein
MDASHKTVTSIELTSEQRHKIAKDLGLTDRLATVPTTISIAGIKSSDLHGAATRAGAAAAVAVIA